MVGRDELNRKVHVDFPVPACFDGSLLFFKKFIDESNNEFAISFYNEDTAAVQHLVKQWIYEPTHRGDLKLWEIEKQPAGRLGIYLNKRWIAKNIDIKIEDIWKKNVFTRIDHFYNVYPIEYNSCNNTVRFVYDYHMTDFLH